MSGINDVGGEGMRHDAVRQAYNRKALDGSPLKSPAGPVKSGPRPGRWRSMGQRVIFVEQSVGVAFEHSVINHDASTDTPDG